jgi:ADP-ribose pyrophosphatase
MNYEFEIVGKTTCHDGFFRVERLRLRHELFGGGWGREIERELFERGHAAAAVLYDPQLDSVVLVEQFRIGALDVHPHPWLLELVAGIIEEGESAEAVIRRETVEEAGCSLEEIVPIAVFTLSPGGSPEQIHLFCGRVDSGRAGGVHGLAHEGEDIKVHVLRTDDALNWLDSGAITSAATIIGLQWLALHRSALRTRWAGTAC